MKTKVFWGIIGVILFLQYSCNDLLDQEPLSSIAPEQYFTDEAQLEAYINGLYGAILPSGGDLRGDIHTDNQAAGSYSNNYATGQWRVPQSDGSNWYFGNIYNCNYFLQTVLPKRESGTLKGSADNIDHYIGEAYFLRGYC